MSKVLKNANIPIKDSIKRWTLNLTDIVENSNKFYNCELIESIDGKFFLMTNYGRLGGSSIKEFRACTSQAEAEREAEKIVKSKIKKGYVEVKLLKVEVGSEAGKSKVEKDLVSVESLEKAGIKIEDKSSHLHPQVQSLIRSLFGSTLNFVETNLDTKSCPLGKLSLDQISKGKDLLDEAKKIITSNMLDKHELNKISSLYYSNIPHNFGFTKIDADILRFDSNEKIDKALSLLEIFENTKDLSKILTKSSLIDEQYQSLNADLQFIDSQDPEWKWVELLLKTTRAKNHNYLGQIKLNRLFKITRIGEDNKFNSLVEEIASTSKGRNIPDLLNAAWRERSHISETEAVYEKANVLPLFHGTRTPNIIGITSKGLLVKHDKIGASGSMYGINALYHGFASKALNYTSVTGSYWASGKDKFGYMFLNDVALGNQKIATSAHNFTWDKLQPNYHSVWAQGGKSGVINDEFMIYRTGQSRIRYLLEICCG